MTPAPVITRAPRRSWHAGRWSFGLLVLAIVLFIAASLQILAARRHLVAGVGQLDHVSLRVGSQQLIANTRARTQLRASLIGAEAEFSAARADLRIWAPVMRHLGWIPRYGPQIAAAPAAADTTFFAARGVVRLIDGLAPVQPLFLASPAGATSLARLVRGIAAGHSQFVGATSDLSAARVALFELPPDLGSAGLNSARDRFAGILPDAGSSARLLALTPAMLGLHSSRRYLLAIQDPTELRATGGFVGAINDLTLRRAQLATTTSSSILPREVSSVSPPLPEAAYTPEGPWVFRDANWSPDFPLSARLERWFYGEDTGRWVDGVINVQDTVMPAILGVTGPVYLPSYKQVVTAANVQALGRRYINSDYHGPLTTGARDTVRKQFLGALSAAVLQRVQRMPPPRWLSLLGTLADAITRRNIMIYARSPQVESALLAADAAGSLTSPGGDFLHIVDDNRSYNKLGPYIRETASYRVAIQPDRSFDATLTLQYHVAPSPANLEGIGPGYGTWGTKHDFQDFLRVYVPPGARLITQRGALKWAPAPAYGLQQFAGRLLIRQGQSRTVIFRYHVPASALAPFPGYQLTVRRQPGTRLSAVAVHITGAPGAPAGASIHRSLSLLQDATFNSIIPPPGTTVPSTVPSLAPPSDPYTPLDEFQDPRHPL